MTTNNDDLPPYIDSRGRAWRWFPCLVSHARACDLGCGRALDIGDSTKTVHLLHYSQRGAPSIAAHRECAQKGKTA